MCAVFRPASLCGCWSNSAREPVLDPQATGTQVSRAARLLDVRGCGDPAPHSDDELEAWRGRTLGEIRYLFLDASSREIAARWRGA